MVHVNKVFDNVPLVEGTDIGRAVAMSGYCGDNVHRAGIVLHEGISLRGKAYVTLQRDKRGELPHGRLEYRNYHVMDTQGYKYID